jgi:hypothetical protein
MVVKRTISRNRLPRKRSLRRRRVRIKMKRRRLRGDIQGGGGRRCRTGRCADDLKEILFCESFQARKIAEHREQAL